MTDIPDGVDPKAIEFARRYLALVRKTGWGLFDYEGPEMARVTDWSDGAQQTAESMAWAIIPSEVLDGTPGKGAAIAERIQELIEAPVEGTTYCSTCDDFGEDPDGKPCPECGGTGIL